MRLGLGLSITGRLRSSGASFILNRFSGAAAAYSLRKLSKDATNVVRVRRSSDNAELDFTPDEINDGTLLTWVGAGDGLVTTWYDQSGNANHATQATAASQPKIVDGGVLVTEGGRAALDNDNAFFFTSIVNDISDYSFFARCNATSKDPIFDDSTRIFFLGGFGTSEGWYYTSTDGYVPSQENVDTSQNGVFSLILSGDNGGSVFFNSQNQLSGGAYTQQFLDGSQGFLANRSGTLPKTGKHQEIILYPSDQSANRTSIEANIADYYGITLT